MTLDYSRPTVFSTATSGQLGLWLIVAVAFIWLGFRKGKGVLWRILGVLGVLNLLVTLGEIARRIGTSGGAPAQPSTNEPTTMH